MYPDGGGLYLQVTATTAKSWIFRYQVRGRSREMGLGSLSAVSLADARLKATDCRRQLSDGIDPIEIRNAARQAALVEASKGVTFRECVASYIKLHEVGWQNAKHAQQWRNTLAAYADPVIGALPVAGVDTGLILKVLEPIWVTKPETASRVRARIEAILDWAKVRGYRTGDNPAKWRGHLDHTLPKQSRVRRVQHHAALPYEAVPEFMVELRKQSGVAARALEFLILTAARTGEVILAGPGELDAAAKIWTIPADRMKARREHRVPLSVRALAALRAVPVSENSAFLFTSGNNRPLSNMAMLALLKRMGREDLTVHGFRSTFRDWAAERTNYPREVAEMALAHTIDNKVEAAYRRGDLFEKRRQLMDAWASYCTTERVSGEVVVPIRA
jgi:integrase